MSIHLKIKIVEPRLTIGKVAIIIKRHRQTIMDWEEKGFIPRSKREISSNYRYWTREQVQKIIDFVNS